MSELRVAIAVEGPTDKVVIEAIVDTILGGSDFVLQVLQPDVSRVFGDAIGGERGLGWSGVFRWCRDASTEGGGRVSLSAVFANHDVVVVHVDADVAGVRYDSAGIVSPPRVDLPCEQTCPPASATTDALRDVVLNWLGEANCPDRLVMCIPSKSMDAWVVVALDHNNRVVAQGNWECRRNPGSQLTSQPKGKNLVKRRVDYERRAEEIGVGWSIAASKLTEAKRFQTDFLTALREVSGQQSA